MTTGYEVVELELGADGVIRETITRKVWKPIEIFHQMVPTDLMEIDGISCAICTGKEDGVDYILSIDIQSLVMEAAQAEEPEKFNAMLANIEAEFGMPLGGS